MTTEPDQAADTPEGEAVPPVEDEIVPSPVVDELSNINSLDDVRDVLNDGIDRLKIASTEDVKATARKVVNRAFAGWRRLLNDVEGKD